MLALFTTLILLLQHASPISAATPLIPALKTESGQGQAMIRGLIELGTRQSYYCPAPRYACVYPDHCCRSSLWRCCRNGTCCEPNYYCVLASNGIIGCCPDGEVCSGDAPLASTSTFYHTITSTSTSTFDIPTTTSRVPTPDTSTFDTPAFGSNSSPTIVNTMTLNTTTTTRGTTTPTGTPSTVRISTSDPLPSSTFIQNISNSAIGSTGNAIHTFLCMVSNVMMVLYVWSF